MMEKSRDKGNMTICRSSCKCSFRRGQLTTQLMDLSSETRMSMEVNEEKAVHQTIEEDNTVDMTCPDHIS